MSTLTDAYSPVAGIVSDILSVIEKMETVPPLVDDMLESVKTQCGEIPEQIQSNRIKIAVVGVIKSGKSTLINAMTRKEVVKRGAGVVTAVTTRIRKGKKNRAVLFLKSWDDINQTLKNVLELFPEDSSSSLNVNPETFDLRRKKDHDYLKQVYDNLVQAFPVTDQGIRPETLVIRNALQGYDTCKDLVGADREQLIFEGRQFADHKLFTGDAANAFYVADACLELFGKTLDPRVELADCQGADSTDPGQLSRVVTYLQQANLIIYCISSRTGLRRSDMRFLKMIQGMGLLENILFVNNCDLSEHETLDDLKASERNTLQELEFLLNAPELYSFSALMRLFCAMEKKLSRRNRKRLALWQEDPVMTSWCSENAERFDARLSGLLSRRHHRLLVSNHLERLFHMCTVLENKANLFLDGLNATGKDREKTRKQIARIKDNVKQLETIVKNAVPGAVAGLTREIEADLDDAFAKDAGRIRKKMVAFVHQTPLDTSLYQNRLKELGIKKILYLMFQDFRRSLDLFVMTDILPDINTLAALQEDRIQSYFQSLLDTYRIDLSKMSLAPGQSEDTDIQVRPAAGPPSLDSFVDVQAIKKILGLTLPDITMMPRYSGRIQTHALTGLGITFVTRFFRALLDKHPSFSLNSGLDVASRRIKKQALQGIEPQIEQFHLRLKNQYFMPLIRAVTRDVTDKIHERFSLYQSLEMDLYDVRAVDQAKKQTQQEKVTGMVTQLQQIRRDIIELKEADVH
jgi:hypothetical protein